MAGMMDFIQKNPYALMGLAQGLLQPRLRGQSALGTGLAGLMGGMQNQMQMNEYNKELAKRTAQEEAIARLTGSDDVYTPTLAPQTQMPTGPQMTPAPGMQSRMGMNMTPIPGTETGPTSLELLSEAIKPQTSQTMLEPMYDRRKDVMTAIGPEKVLAAQLEREMNPMANMPEGIQELLIYAQNPALAKLKAQIDPNSTSALLAAAGITEGTPEAREFLASRGKNTTMINMAQEKAFETAEGARYSKEIFGPISNAAVSSNSVLQNIQRSKDLLANFTSGALAPTTGQLANIFQSLGVDPTKLGLDKAGPKEAFEALSNDFVLSSMERLKGVASDSDVKMLRAMQARVGGTVEGNLLILDAAERMWSRAGDVNRVVQNYVKANGGSPTGVETAIENYWKQNPLWSPDEAKNINSLLGKQVGANSPDAIKLMSRDELSKLDVTKFTPAQAAAFRIRLQLLGGQP